jgi:hypothetical protein
MRLLLDESVPKRLGKYLPRHEVMTVVEMGWGGTKNGALLKLAGSSFDAFVTVDKNLPYQQNLPTLPVAGCRRGTECPVQRAARACRPAARPGRCACTTDSWLLRAGRAPTVATE